MRRRDDDWLESPSDHEPDVRAQYRRRVLRETGGRALTWIMAGVLVMLVAIFYVLSNPTPTPAPDVNLQLAPSSKTAAWAGVESWLEDKPLGGEERIVSWDGIRRVSLKDGSDVLHAQVDRFTIRSKTGWWRVDATVRPDGSLTAYPSVSRLDVDGSATPNGTATWDGVLQDMTASQSVSTLADQWGRALMGSDVDALTVLMRDPENRSYQPLGLGDVGGVTVDAAAYLNRGDVDRNALTSTRAVLRVTIVLAAKDTGSKQTQYSYDVLIADPDGSPRILAWGAPGTGVTLGEYANRMPVGWKPDSTLSDQ